MSALIIDGKALAAEIQQSLAAQAAALREAGVVPRLDVVLVGDDPASHTYVRSKVRTAARLGIDSRDHLLPAAIPQAEVIALVQRLNGDPEVHGILVQSPLPPPMVYLTVLEQVDPRKDVDGLHPFNAGALMYGPIPMPPCTPAGVLELIRRTGIDLVGREAVVVGRSMLVGKPVAMLLLQEHMTVTMCHSRTRDLPSVCRRADVLVAAVGRARMIDAGYVKEGAVVIDVGINRTEQGLVGDVDFEGVREKARAITPVPGGVGPMTITMLMKNTLAAARMSANA